MDVIISKISPQRIYFCEWDVFVNEKKIDKQMNNNQW